MAYHCFVTDPAEFPHPESIAFPPEFFALFGSYLIPARLHPFLRLRAQAYLTQFRPLCFALYSCWSTASMNATGESLVVGMMVPTPMLTVST